MDIDKIIETYGCDPVADYLSTKKCGAKDRYLSKEECVAPVKYHQCYGYKEHHVVWFCEDHNYQWMISQINPRPLSYKGETW